nr:MAG TPA: hypothetical protein [Caudoviricetes sp.]
MENGYRFHNFCKPSNPWKDNQPSVVRCILLIYGQNLIFQKTKKYLL